MSQKKKLKKMILLKMKIYYKLSMINSSSDSLSNIEYNLYKNNNNRALKKRRKYNNKFYGKNFYE